MIDGYNSKSCNALQRPFYRPVEAAIRWCGLIAYESQILAALDPADAIPKTGQFPQWPCLQSNTEKILDAILHNDIPHGRDGRTVDASDHVARARITVRHTDLKEWMIRHYPDQKPLFLFDDTERATHSAINADSFRALQVDRDAARAELAKARDRTDAIVKERDALLGERNSLRAMVDRMGVPGDRAESTYLNIIGGLLGLMLGQNDNGDPLSSYRSQAEIITDLVDRFPTANGISKSNLESKFADANRAIKQP